MIVYLDTNIVIYAGGQTDQGETRLPRGESGVRRDAQAEIHFTFLTNDWYNGGKAQSQWC